MLFTGPSRFNGIKISPPRSRPGLPGCNSLSRRITMPNQSIISEFLEFLKFRKRYWLLPIVLVLVCLGALIVFTETSAVAPFIYALF